ncbi:MAG: hypothetical protein JWQ35_261 [Bacteriovoracaceae bacterium]|nr:hypothetical protein [Bacteriovoracaceae bacterium]
MARNLLLIFVFSSFSVPAFGEGSKTSKKKSGVGRKCTAMVKAVGKNSDDLNELLVLSNKDSDDVIEIIPGVFLRKSFFTEKNIHQFQAVGEPIGIKDHIVGGKIKRAPFYQVEHKVLSLLDTLSSEQLIKFVAENIYHPEFVNEKGFEILMRFINRGYDEQVVRSLSFSLHGLGQFPRCKGWAGSAFGLVLLKHLVQNGRTDELIDTLLFAEYPNDPSLWVRIPEVESFIRKKSLVYISAQKLREAGFGTDLKLSVNPLKSILRPPND